MRWVLGGCGFLILALLVIVVALIYYGLSRSSVPSDDELKPLVLQSLLSFNNAVTTKSFDEFHAQTAKVWQKQISAKEVQEAFKEFIDKQFDISAIKVLEPTFENKQIDFWGSLVVSGIYSMTSAKVHFELKYVKEDGAWKLFSISINTSGYPAPSDSDLKRLVLQSLLSFNEAVKTKDFRSLL